MRNQNITYEELFSIMKDLLALENTRLLITEYDKPAEYLTSTDTVVVDSRSSNEEVLASIIHESRHAYQLYEINYSTKTKEVKQWKNNFDNYLNFGNEGYYDQIVELDANAFTLYILRIIFGVDPWLNDKFDAIKVMKLIKDISQDFTISEVHQSCSFVLGGRYKKEANPLDNFRIHFNSFKQKSPSLIKKNQEP